MRVFSRIFCGLLATALAVVSVLVLVEIALIWFSQSPWLVDTSSWFDTATGYTWSSTGLRLGLLVAIVAGALLLAVAWAPRRAITVPAPLDGPDHVTMTVRRREAQGRIESQVDALPYVTGAQAVVTANRIDVTAHSTRGSDPAIKTSIEIAAASAADQLGLGHVERRVRVRNSARRAA